VQQDCEAISGAAAANELLRHQALCYFICDFMSKHGMVDERIALLEEMYTRICRGEWTCRSCAPGVVSVGDC
jgi:hypothetical protein